MVKGEPREGGTALYRKRIEKWSYARNPRDTTTMEKTAMARAASNSNDTSGVLLTSLFPPQFDCPLCVSPDYVSPSTDTNAGAISVAPPPAKHMKLHHLSHATINWSCEVCGFAGNGAYQLKVVKLHYTSTYEQGQGMLWEQGSVTVVAVTTMAMATTTTTTASTRCREKRALARPTKDNVVPEHNNYYDDDNYSGNSKRPPCVARTMPLPAL